MAFTAGSLFRHESVTLASLYLELGDWPAVQHRVSRENLLQSRTLSTLKRVCREIVSRLRTLQAAELEYLVDSRSQEQAYVLWLAVCRRYSFIADFAIEVLRERYITLKTDLQYEDFDAFFNRKAEWHAELDEISPATRRKVRQVLFKILREVDLLTVDNMINPSLPSPALLALIRQNHPQEIRYFPMVEADLRERPRP